MSEICNICGLPKEICGCKERALETQGGINVFTDKKRYGKIVTFISGIDPDSVGGGLKGFLKQLKTSCACGGAIKPEGLMLQGDHKKRIEEKLRTMGFTIG
jgi:translation initiation factor 1